MATTILVPSIDSVTITPNPVNQNSNFLIAVSVSEFYQEIPSVVVYTGTRNAGSEWGLTQGTTITV